MLSRTTAKRINVDVQPRDHPHPLDLDQRLRLRMWLLLYLQRRDVAKAAPVRTVYLIAVGRKRRDGKFGHPLRERRGVANSKGHPLVTPGVGAGRQVRPRALYDPKARIRKPHLCPNDDHGQDHSVGHDHLLHHLKRISKHLAPMVPSNTLVDSS